MATYKVPQDVEAEDKLLGPFTLKQFIYLIIVAISLWLTFLMARSTFTLIFLPLTLTPGLFFGFMVFLGIKNQSQPAELYLAALVRYFLKPHKRIWSQDGYMETVHITAPKKEVRTYSDNLSKTEVRSRLSNLANLMDSRGWAAKDVRYQPNVVLPQQNAADDRLVSINQLPQTLDPIDVHASDDVMDESSSAVAQHFDEMIKQNQERYRQEAVAHMKDPNYNPYPNMHQHIIKPLDQKDESQPTTHQEQQRPEKSSDRATTVENEPKSNKPTAAEADPRITQLAQNDDFSVQTIATEAQRLKSLESGDEVTLH